MICRHDKNDPRCSSHPNYVAPYREVRSNYQDPNLYKPAPVGSVVVKPVKPVITPDASNYEIVEALQVGNHLVMKVKYPNCASCAYEGTKVLVYLDISPLTALKWNKIDPHFSNERRSVKEAPSPAARFPASNEGWDDAIFYAQRKAPKK